MRRPIIQEKNTNNLEYCFVSGEWKGKQGLDPELAISPVTLAMAPLGETKTWGHVALQFKRGLYSPDFLSLCVTSFCIIRPSNWDHHLVLLHLPNQYPGHSHLPVDTPRSSWAARLTPKLSSCQMYMLCPSFKSHTFSAYLPSSRYSDRYWGCKHSIPPQTGWNTEVLPSIY